MKFDHVFCSDLKRTRATCANVLKASEQNYEVEYTDHIREQNFGTWQGKPLSEKAEANKNIVGDPRIWNDHIKNNHQTMVSDN